MEREKRFMLSAIKEAKRAKEKDEVPLKNGKIFPMSGTPLFPRVSEPVNGTIFGQYGLRVFAGGKMFPQISLW